MLTRKVRIDTVIVNDNDDGDDVSKQQKSDRTRKDATRCAHAWNHD
jgi:hypothetical protein